MAAHDANWRESLIRLGKALEVPEIRRRLIFVAAMFGLFVLGLHIPAPFVDPSKIEQIGGALLGMIDMMSGGALKRLSILALGIVPYINASIIMQLLGIAVPSIQRMQKEGESGRKTISKITRYGTVILAIIQATGLSIFLQSRGAVLETGLGPFSIVPLIIVMVAGTSFLMWVGEQITDKGIGNGVSLIIFAGIMIRLPFTMKDIVYYALINKDQNLAAALGALALIITIFLAIVVFITWVHQATRNLPIQHAKRVVGGRTFSAANTYLPLKVITAGVIPIIFAISLVMVPSTIAGFLEQSVQFKGAPWLEYLKILSPGYSGTLGWAGGLVGGIVYFLLVVFFTYFYTAVVYNVQDISDNLKKHGSFIPGLRPGKQTEEYIDKVLTRLTFAGALILGVIALLPYIVPVVLQFVAKDAALSAQIFPLWGGTSLLIVVGVALETMKQLEAHLVMRHYEGFIK